MLLAHNPLSTLAKSSLGGGRSRLAGSLGTPLGRPGRGALWSSVTGALLIAGVVGANLWSMWHAQPELVPLEPLERLSALQAQPQPEASAANHGRTVVGPNAGAAVGSASAAEAGHFASVQGGVAGGSAAADAGVVRVVAPTVGAQPAASSEVTRSWVVQSGESLSAALAHLQITGQAQRDVITAYAAVRKPELLQAGWRLWGKFQTAGVVDSGAMQTLVIAPQQGEGVTIAREVNGLAARIGGLPGTTQRQALRCGIVGTLEASLQRCGESEALAAQLAVLLSDRLHPALELKAGDELRVVFDKLMDGDQLVRYLDVEALEVRSVTGQKTVAIHFEDGYGVGGYFGMDGRSQEAMFLRQPLRSGNRTSGFGMRLHPILHKMKAHYGVDFGAPRGTPVYAAADGVLVTAHRAGAAGNLVRLRHGDGYVTEYMHLSKFNNLGVGEQVRKGQVVGFVGSTGRSTGPHLHFGVRKNGDYLDPTTLGDVLEPGLPARDRKLFDAHAAEMRRLLDALGGAAGAS